MENTQKFSVEKVSEIRIKSSLSQVNVVGGNESDIVLRWTDTNRRKTAVEQDGKALLVKDKASVALYGVYGLVKLKEDKELTLEIPKDFRGEIQIESNDECVRVLGVSCSADLSVKTTVGAVEISATDMQSYRLSSTAGSISLRGVTSESGIQASTSGGNIDCVCAESVQAYLLDCRSEIGECHMPNYISRGGKRLQLRSKSGQISVIFTGTPGEE